MADAISWQALYIRLKQLIASKKHLSDWTSITAGQTLANGIGFSARGLRGFSTEINNAFADVNVLVSADEMAACKTVRDLAELIFSKAS